MKKVLWRDGDVISERHFYALENWTEKLVGLVNQQSGTYGMVRNAALQPGFNKAGNIRFKQIDGSHYRVEIEQIQAVNMFGLFMKIDGVRALDFHFRPVQRSADGHFLLYLLPQSGTGNGTPHPSDVEVETGATLYDAPYELSASNDANIGVCICRFKVEDNQAVIDESYIPFGIHVDSTVGSGAAHERVLQKLQQWNSLLERYTETLKPTPDMIVVWNAAGNFLRACNFLKPLLEQPHQPIFQFFWTLQQFLNSVRTDVKILSFGWPQESLKKRANELIDLLDQPVVVPVGQQFDLLTAFSLAEKMMDASVKFLSYMPAGPITEKALTISRVDVQKEAAGNKVTVTLEEETGFTKGKSRLLIQLRDFARTEPMGSNVRVGLGAVIFAQLLDLKGHLKKVPGESFGYTIDCPPEVVTRDRASQLTLYLPPPLGEGVIDLKNHITIVVKD